MTSDAKPAPRILVKQDTGTHYFFAPCPRGLSGALAEELGELGAGAIEAAVTILSLRNGCVPPTINYRDPDPECDLFIPTQALAREIRYGLSNNIGLGGHNGCALFGRADR